jgi:hypothetical protein
MEVQGHAEIRRIDGTETEESLDQLGVVVLFIEKIRTTDKHVAEEVVIMAVDRVGSGGFQQGEHRSNKNAPFTLC